MSLAPWKRIRINRNVKRTKEKVERKLDKSKGGFRRRALLALYSTRINYLTLKISKCRLVRLWLD